MCSSAFDDLIYSLNKLNQLLNEDVQDEFNEMESTEVLKWFADKTAEGGGNYSNVVRSEGKTKVSCAINRLKQISEDIYEEDYIRLSAQLIYAGSLIDGVDNIIEADPYMGIHILRRLIKEIEMIIQSSDDNMHPIEVSVLAENYARAHLVIGLCYAYGKGVIQSTANAIKYIKLAAEYGIAEADDILTMLDE